MFQYSILYKLQSQNNKFSNSQHSWAPFTLFMIMASNKGKRYGWEIMAGRRLTPTWRPVNLFSSRVGGGGGGKKAFRCRLTLARHQDTTPDKSHQPARGAALFPISRTDLCHFERWMRLEGPLSTLLRKRIADNCIARAGAVFRRKRCVTPTLGWPHSGFNTLWESITLSRHCHRYLLCPAFVDVG